MRLARVNEAGRRIGEGHHMARLSDREVNLSPTAGLTMRRE